MIRKVLVTGGTGFIGSHVVEALLRKKCDVVLLKRSSSDTWRLKSCIKRLKCYDTDRIELKDIFKKEKPKAILHLATYYRKRHAPEDIEPMFSANIAFPVRLLELAREFDVKCFINTGTFFEYMNRPLPINEDTSEGHPFNLYAMTKMAFEDILRNYSSGIKAVTLKVFTPYGPRDSDNKLIPSIIKKALGNEEIGLSQGLQKLDFVYVKDIAQAYIKCLENIESIKSGHEAINIGSGLPLSIREVVSIMEEILMRPIKKKWGRPAEGDFDITFADTSKAKELLGWRPAHDIFGGLRETIDYYRGVRLPASKGRA